MFLWVSCRDGHFLVRESILWFPLDKPFGCPEAVGYRLDTPNWERCHRAGADPGEEDSDGRVCWRVRCVGPMYEAPAQGWLSCMFVPGAWAVIPAFAGTLAYPLSPLPGIRLDSFRPSISLLPSGAEWSWGCLPSCPCACAAQPAFRSP